MIGIHPIEKEIFESQLKVETKIIPLTENPKWDFKIIARRHVDGATLETYVSGGLQLAEGMKDKLVSDLLNDTGE